MKSCAYFRVYSIIFASFSGIADFVPEQICDTSTWDPVPEYEGYDTVVEKANQWLQHCKASMKYIMGQVTELWLSCYLILLSIAKPGNKPATVPWPDPLYGRFTLKQMLLHRLVLKVLLYKKSNPDASVLHSAIDMYTGY